ncbi:MAG: STAS domain-containing protein [Pseudobdellovibrionaceae bacterium]
MVTLLEAIARPGWVGLKISGRVDAFNDRQIIQSFERSIGSSRFIALDLSNCEFLSLQMLKFLSEINRNLGRNGGELGLVRPNHNVRRQIEIFLGTKNFRVYGSMNDLQNGYSAQPRAEFHNLPAESLRS